MERGGKRLEREAARPIGRERIANHLGDLGYLGNDGGLAFGWLQIRADYHPALAARYVLLDGPQNLEAGWAVYEAAGGSFAPWACWARA